jgi:hypothetical protein
MNCIYCDQISETDTAYVGRMAEYDLSSAAPRCSWHWRYLCGQCGNPVHFMALSYCPHKEAFFCTACAQGREEIVGTYWA